MCIRDRCSTVNLNLSVNRDQQAYLVFYPFACFSLIACAEGDVGILQV